MRLRAVAAVVVTVGAFGLTGTVPLAAAEAPHTMTPVLVSCGGRHLHAKPGQRLHVTASILDDTATLTGRFTKKSAGQFSDPVKNGRVHLAGRSYPLHRAEYTQGPGVLLAKVGYQTQGRLPRYLYSLCLVRMTADAPVMAAVATSSEGNQCCYNLTMYPSGQKPVVLDSATVGAAFEQVGSRLVIATADPRFTGALTDYADTTWPIRIDTVADDRLKQVTRHYPALIRQDAKQQWTWFTHPTNGPHGGLGALASWAADEYLLGRGSQAQARLQELNHHGRLKARPGWPSGKHYLRALNRLLKETGYKPH